MLKSIDRFNKQIHNQTIN